MISKAISLDSDCAVTSVFDQAGPLSFFFEPPDRNALDARSQHPQKDRRFAGRVECTFLKPSPFTRNHCLATSPKRKGKRTMSRRGQGENCRSSKAAVGEEARAFNFRTPAVAVKALHQLPNAGKVECPPKAGYRLLPPSTSWAKVKGQKSTPAAAPVKAKRKISAAHRAKLAAAAKARWARVKMGKK